MAKLKTLGRCTIRLVLGCAALVILSPLLEAQVSTTAVKQAVQEMELASGAPIEISFSPLNGLATIIGTQMGRPISMPGLEGAAPERISLAFFSTYGAAFGITDTSQLQLTRLQGPDAVGMHHVRFQQLHNGVPIRAAKLTVHLRGANVVTVEAQTLSPAELVDTAATVLPTDASRVAQQLLAEASGVSDAVLSTPKLEIFNLGIFTRSRAPTQLAWFIEAIEPNLSFDELIWVNAQTGAVVYHFSQVAHALMRKVYNGDLQHLVRSEGQPATGDSQTDLAYDYTADAYYYFLNQHGRDSYDTKGGPISWIVHAVSQCSGETAFSLPGLGTYCDSSPVADDVIGHEITHMILSSENVLYAGEGIPVSEAYATIFGETIDQLNGRGNDSPEVKWKWAEDIPSPDPPVDMMDPAKSGFPGKVSDLETRCNGIEGGVPAIYFDSWIITHAYALMTDGGSYNGRTIQGIGLGKAAKIHYRAMTYYLSEAASFLGSYNAVRRSCLELIGSYGITGTDCDNVTDALKAVEMSRPLCPEFLLTANNHHSIDVRLSREDTVDLEQQAADTFYAPVSVGDDLGVNYGAFAIVDKNAFFASTDEHPAKLYLFTRARRVSFTQKLLRTLDSDPKATPDYGLDLTTGVHRPLIGPLKGGTVPFLLENQNVAFATGQWIARGNLCRASCDKPDLINRNAYDFSSIFTGWTLGKSSNLADLDGDGFVDMLASEQSTGGAVSSTIYFLKGDFDSQQSRFFFRSPVPLLKTANQPATHLALGDFNNDGIVDALVGQDDDGDPGAAFLFLGRGDGTFAQKGIKSFDTRPDIDTGSDQPGGGMFQPYDFDHDGILDIISAASLYGPVLGNPDTAQLLFFRGRGDGTFESPRIIEPNLIAATAFTVPLSSPSDVRTKPIEVVNADFPQLKPGDTTTSHSPIACAPTASAGTYNITARFPNISRDTLSRLFFFVETLDGGNVLCNADGGAAAGGAILTPQWDGDLADGLLAPNESFVVSFQIGLASDNPFTFLIDLFAVVQGRP